MRVIIGSANSSAANSKTQFVSYEAPRILEAQFKARPANSSLAYVGTSSAVSATEGWGFDSGSSFTEVLKITATVKGTTYWMTSGDTTSFIDYAFVMEN